MCDFRSQIMDIQGTDDRHDRQSLIITGAMEGPVLQTNSTLSYELHKPFEITKLRMLNKLYDQLYLTVIIIINNYWHDAKQSQFALEIKSCTTSF